MKSRFNEIVTAHLSDIHQNELYEEVIAGISPEARLLVIHGDWAQCHKNKRPSKGRIKGLPKFDNGCGERVQGWALEAAAYINHGTPIPKGQKVDFRDIPRGELRKGTENYETMLKFINEVVDDTCKRLERITEAMYKKNKETGLEMVFFPGHDNAHDLWIEELFPHVGSLKNLAEWVADGGILSDGIYPGDPMYQTGGHFLFTNSPSLVAVHESEIPPERAYTKVEYRAHTEMGYDPKDNVDDILAACVVASLYPLPEARKALREFIGVDECKIEEQYIRDKAEYELRALSLQRKYRSMLGKVPVLVIASHEGPKEVSDIVLGTEGEEGKATENRALFEKMFSEPNETDTKVLWVYGNDGLPVPVTKEIIYGAGSNHITVHHLAELDKKGDPLSREGGVTYIGHKTGRILAPGDY